MSHNITCDKCGLAKIFVDEKCPRCLRGTVLQPWIDSIGMKMQSILLSGFRAPDQYTKKAKKCVRWLRSKCQIDADPKKQSYMETVYMNDEMINDAMDELEYCSVHYVHHFADSFAVLAYHHPDPEVCKIAYKIHNLIAVELFHFVPETKAQFLHRHKDKF